MRVPAFYLQQLCQRLSWYTTRVQLRLWIPFDICTIKSAFILVAGELQLLFLVHYKYCHFQVLKLFQGHSRIYLPCIFAHLQPINGRYPPNNVRHVERCASIHVFLLWQRITNEAAKICDLKHSIHSWWICSVTRSVHLLLSDGYATSLRNLRIKMILMK